MLQFIGFVLAGAVGGVAAFLAIGLARRRLLMPDSSARRRQLVPLLAGGSAFVAGFAIVLAVWHVTLGARLNGNSSETAILDEMNSFRFVQVLEKYHPETRDKFAAIAHEAVEKHDPGLVQQQTTRLVQQYFAQYVPRTSDDAIVAFATSLIDLLKFLQTENVETCKSLASGGNLSAGLTLERIRPTLNAMADVIEAAATKPQDPPDAAKAQPLVQGVFAALYASKDDQLVPVELLVAPQRAPADKLCHTMQSFYRAVVALPKADASVVMRQLIKGAP